MLPISKKHEESFLINYIAFLRVILFLFLYPETLLQCISNDSGARNKQCKMLHVIIFLLNAAGFVPKQKERITSCKSLYTLLGRGVLLKVCLVCLCFQRAGLFLSTEITVSSMKRSDDMNVTEKLNMLTHHGDDKVMQFGFVYKHFMFIIGDKISGVYNFL